MGNSLINPLQALISTASKRLSPQTGETERLAHDVVVIVCDKSGSMSGTIGEQRKIDFLHDALEDLPFTVGIAFSDLPRRFFHGERFEPEGSTAMHLALNMAREFSPTRTVIVSDGLPDSEELALAAASRLPGAIDVIYCGREDDWKARSFMDRLGRSVACRPENLRVTLRSVLALPSPKDGA